MIARMESIRKGATLVVIGDQIVGYYFWFERDLAVALCAALNGTCDHTWSVHD